MSSDFDASGRPLTFEESEEYCDRYARVMLRIGTRYNQALSDMIMACWDKQTPIIIHIVIMLEHYAKNSEIWAQNVQ